MSTFDRTIIHESGHAVLRMLEQKYVGPLVYATVIPDADSLGKVAGDSREQKFKGWPARRAAARLCCAGFVAERLAGFGSGAAPGGDVETLAKIAHFANQPKRFLRQGVAGAEFMLRCHWGGVLRLAARLRELGILVGPAGLELARMAVFEGPPEPLATDCDTFERLVLDLDGDPEMNARMHAALEQGGLLPKPRKPKSARRPASTRKPRMRPHYALALPRKPQKKMAISEMRRIYGDRMPPHLDKALARREAAGVTHV